MYDSIFGKTDQHDPCFSMRFHIYFHKDVAVFHKGNGEEIHVRIFDEENYDIKKIKQIHNYIRKISKKCGFFVMEVTIQTEKTAHLNIFFGENVNDKIILNRYEPHGVTHSEKDDQVYQVMDQLFYFAEDFEAIEPENKHQGAQTHSNDRIGYCVMFSLFWVYVVLNIIKHNIQRGSYKPSPEWIDNVEKYYIKSTSSTEMMAMVITFAIIMFNNYIASLPSSKQKNVLERVHEYATDYMSDDKKHSYEKVENDVSNDDLKLEDEVNKSDYSRKELIRLARKDPEYTYESWENARIKEDRELKAAWDEFKMRRGYNPKTKYVPKLRMGEKCKENNDCFSKRCKYDEDEKESYCAAPFGFDE